MDYNQAFDDDFRELFTKRLRENENFGSELWSALANVDWFHKDDPENIGRGHSFRGAGSLIASMLCHGDYLDWYCSGPDGIVSSHVAEAMATKGWRYEAENICIPPEAFMRWENTPYNAIAEESRKQLFQRDVIIRAKT